MTVVDLFSTCFRHLSTISNFSIYPKKVIGPDASEKHFRSSGGGREGIWGRPGGVREASCEVLGVSGGVRGASWEGLGRSWGDLGATFKAVRFRNEFLIDFDRERGSKGRHLGRQNGAKIDSKTMQNPSRFSRAKKYPSRPSWGRLEAVLGRSWPILTALGVVLGRFGAGWGSQKR